MGTAEKRRQALLAVPASMTVADVDRVLKADGWEGPTIKGSHHSFRKAGEPRPITFPVHDKQVERAALADIARRIRQPGE